MASFALTIFLAAFLLFQIQPVIAKIILPWFGGSATVWSTCMLFFQALLLGGYLYAHWLTRTWAGRRQAVIHTVLLALSLLSLPVIPNESWKAAPGGNPTWQILGLLGVTVGLPYLLLSTTSPLVQAWYAAARPGGMPYRLYALSNFGSMLALISYPVAVEPFLATRVQAWGWSAGYVAFAAACVALAWKRAAHRAEVPAAPGETVERPGVAIRLLWMALAACPSILLLAITSFLTQDVAAIPFLWILPLIVYLLSFILCFEAPRFYVRLPYLAALPAALGVMTYLLRTRRGFTMEWIIAATVTALFLFCMVCHGELVRVRPHPRYLTSFYVMLALGGVLGGMLVGLVAPNLFSGYYELPAGLALCAALAALVVSRERRQPGLAAVLAAAVVAYCAVLGWITRDTVRGYRVVARNFYSQIRVSEVDQQDGLGVRRKLLHGSINHGEQILDNAYRTSPVTYFCLETGIGRAMRATEEQGPRRVGILGLGCGTLAAYGRPGDVFRVYEINQQVVDVARREFTYLSESQARVEIILGDGRLALEREPVQNYDLLVMDAFSGDSVPVHLITREAFRAYLRHLKPGGILAVNISNRYLDLRPVMERAAAQSGRMALHFSFDPEDDSICFGADWVLILDRATWETRRAHFSGGQPLEPHPRFRAWTDDFSNLLAILK